MTVELHCGDCVEVLKTLPEKSVQCCVTSPPYYGLRDYGVDGQIGLESTPDEYVSKLVQVFREVKRVMKDDGTLWLNLGDSYASNGDRAGMKLGAHKKGCLCTYCTMSRNGLKTTVPAGMKQKDLIGIPWMVAFALRADGWYLRSDIIWAKPNPMPESVKDRPTKSHEYLFLLSKSQKYYYDAEAIFEASSNPSATISRYKYEFMTGDKHESGGYSATGGKHTAGYKNLTRKGLQNYGQQPCGKDKNREAGIPDPDYPQRNKRTVWTINTQPFKGAHFAVMPEKLVEPCILAGSRSGDTVVDPFSGSGTVGVVSQKLGRNYIGIDLNHEYIDLSKKRLSATPVCLTGVPL